MALLSLGENEEKMSPAPRGTEERNAVSVAWETCVRDEDGEGKGCDFWVRPGTLERPSKAVRAVCPPLLCSEKADIFPPPYLCDHLL